MTDTDDTPSAITLRVVRDRDTHDGSIYDEAKKLRARIEQLEADSGWLPIETRPDNDKPCWIAHAPTSTMVVGYTGRRALKGVWYLMWGHRMLDWTPTHWRPLPTPPAISSVTPPKEG